MTKFSKIFLFMVGIFLSQQVEATVKADIIQKANERFIDLAAIVQSKGPETIANSINSGQEKNYQNHPIMPVVNGDASNGGHMIWVEESEKAGAVVIASPNPAEVGRDIPASPLVKQTIEELKKSADEKVSFSVEGGKKTVVAWGCRALMNEKLNKEKHKKFFCYVIFDNPGT